METQLQFPFAWKRQRDQRVYDARKAEGICTKCGLGDIANEGGAFCTDCLEQRRLKWKLKGMREVA